MASPIMAHYMISAFNFIQTGNTAGRVGLVEQKLPTRLELLHSLAVFSGGVLLNL
jgi:hypothetical protein